MGLVDEADGHGGAALEPFDEVSHLPAGQAFVAAGGTVTSPPADTPWGSYTAYAADPDGHPWEFTWLPAFPLTEKGDLWLPENM